MHSTPLQNSISFFLPYYCNYYFSLQYSTFLLLLSSSSSNINLSFLSCFHSLFTRFLCEEKDPLTSLLTYFLKHNHYNHKEKRDSIHEFLWLYKTETKKEITLQRFEASMGDFLDGLLYTQTRAIATTMGLLSCAKLYWVYFLPFN